eukprot:Rmarinus@m.12875
MASSSRTACATVPSTAATSHLTQPSATRRLARTTASVSARPSRAGPIVFATCSSRTARACAKTSADPRTATPLVTSPLSTRSVTATASKSLMATHTPSRSSCRMRLSSSGRRGCTTSRSASAGFFPAQSSGSPTTLSLSTRLTPTREAP